MARYHRRHVVIRSMLLLVVLPLLCVGASYALFAQDLSVSGSVASVAYVSNQSMVMTYTKSESGASPYTYSFSPMTIKNGGMTATTIWQANFTVPSDTSSVNCPTTVICSLSGTTMTILSNTNGAIATGGSTSFNFSFQSAVSGYTLQDIVLYANYASTYASVSGLTVNVTKGKSTKQGPNYLWPLTVTVTNNSGKPIGSWRVTISPFASGYSISGLPAGVTSTSGTTLVLTSTNEIATGSQQQVTATVSTGKTATWNITSSTTQGKS